MTQGNSYDQLIIDEAVTEAVEPEQKTDQQVIDELGKEKWIPSDHVRSPITNCPKCHEQVITRSTGPFGRVLVQLGNESVEDTKVVKKTEKIQFSHGTANTVMTFHKLLPYPQLNDVFHPDVCPQSRANKEKTNGRQHARA